MVGVAPSGRIHLESLAGKCAFNTTCSRFTLKQCVCACVFVKEGNCLLTLHVAGVVQTMNYKEGSRNFTVHRSKESKDALHIHNLSGK